MDSTGKYVLSDKGEAIISDVDMSKAVDAEGHNRVFYEIFVGSFSDSNGDGIGDLRGIINRLDYLNDGDPTSGQSLGIEGIWLTPIFKSSSYHKYDVMDYYTIDPDFGTMDDLKELIALCHQRNILLIIDLPINHTSLLHSSYAKFQAAHRNGQTEDPYYNYYSFYSQGQTPPAGRAFTQISGTSDYYECNFSGSMPELNFDNEAVRQDMVDVAKFYLQMGMDGFRFDAAKYIYFGDNTKSAQFWDWYMAELRKIKPDVYAVAEVWDGDAVCMQYYSSMNCFNFSTSQTSGSIATAAGGGNVNAYTSYVEDYLKTVQAIRPESTIVPFVSNHDMDRAAGFVQVATGEMHVSANLYLLGPGSPFIYYGEEIGIRGSRGGANTDANRRLAMLWGDGDTVADPEGTTYNPKNQTKSTVANQLGDGSGLYTYYKRLLMIRAAHPEISRGDYKALKISSRVGAFTATWEGSTVCVVHNTTDKEMTVDLAELGDFSILSAFIGRDVASLKDGKLVIGPQTSVILR